MRARMSGRPHDLPAVRGHSYSRELAKAARTVPTERSAWARRSRTGRRHCEFIARQHVFSSPLPRSPLAGRERAAQGSEHVSRTGANDGRLPRPDRQRVGDDAHLRRTGGLQPCSFEGRPRILRQTAAAGASSRATRRAAASAGSRTDRGSFRVMIEVERVSTPWVRGAFRRVRR